MTQSSEIEMPMKTLHDVFSQSLPSHCAVEIGDEAVSPKRLLCRQIAPATINHRCPICRSIVYCRRQPLCGVCSRPLPQEYLFEPWEAERISGMLKAERRRHQQWLARQAG
jgi:hypothetical protein